MLLYWIMRQYQVSKMSIFRMSGISFVPNPKLKILNLWESVYDLLRQREEHRFLHEILLPCSHQHSLYSTFTIFIPSSPHKFCLSCSTGWVQTFSTTYYPRKNTLRVQKQCRYV